MHVFAVLELNGGERDTAGETQPNGDHNLDDQTQMTSFEIDLKDKRFVAQRALEAAHIIFSFQVFAELLM